MNPFLFTDGSTLVDESEENLSSLMRESERVCNRRKLKVNVREK